MDKKIKKLKPILQKYRLSVIAMFVIFSLAWVNAFLGLDIIGFFVGPEKDAFYRYSSSSFYLIVGFMVVMGLFLNQYLSADNTKVFKTKFEDTDHTIELISRTEKKFEDELEQVLNVLDKTRDEVFRKAGDSLNKEQQEELIKKLKEQLLESASKDLLEDLRDKTNRIIDRDTSKRLGAHFGRTMERLTAEISALGKRSRVNLIIGSLTAFAGVSIFMLFVFERVGDTTAQAYLVKEFAPRISLVIVIELFAYFFLGLYKANLSEIKYFHNELTNVEHKHMALEEAIASADKDTVKEIVKDFAKTERNFLLKKGESTVSLEDRKITLDEQNGIIDALVSKVGKTSK